jgi:hypothetical protein
MCVCDLKIDALLFGRDAISHIVGATNGFYSALTAKSLKKSWCPGAESNHRRADFPSFSLPINIKELASLKVEN